MSSRHSSASDTNSPKFVADNVARLSANDKALRASESRYRRLFETARDGIILLNSETAQIEDVNPFLIELLGYSYDDLWVKRFGRLVSFKDTVMNKEAFAELQDKRFIRYNDLPLIGKNGDRFFRRVCE